MNASYLFDDLIADVAWVIILCLSFVVGYFALLKKIDTTGT